MINRRLSSAEAAARLGVKPATVYAYVSRGLLHPQRSPKGSTFDAHEVAVLARTARHPGRPGQAAAGRRTGMESGAGDPVFVTELTLIDDGRLYYRGLDAVELSRTLTFEQTAEWLWTGEWSGPSLPEWEVPSGTTGPLARALAGLPPGTAPLERYMAAVVVASLCDDLRHDLNPAGIPVTARGLLAVLAAALPGNAAPAARRPSSRGSMSARVWQSLTGRAPTGGGLAAVEGALVLAADHELAPSTLAARVAASFRADPYTVVLTGLGPASGSWQAGSTGAPGEVEALLADAATLGPEKAIGDRLRRSGDIPHGFGMPLYPAGDPRGAELLDRLDGLGAPERTEVVRSVVQLGRERGFPPANFDMALGALSFCAGMAPGSGQAIFTLGKVVGWLAHAIEEYTLPTRFRSRADYVGPLPADTPPG
jgi:citrate synthase